jgi:acetyl esterase
MPMHPTIEKMLESARAVGKPALSAGDPAQARAQVAAMRTALGSGPAELGVEALKIPTRAGTMPARLYRPTTEAQGLILYLHGGGWVCGQLDDFDGLARMLSALSGCALLLIDYRLAPEHPFPAGLHDAEDGLAWACGEGMAKLGKSVPLVVAGDSAGANLGIAAVLEARGRIPVALQAYFYPVTDSDMTLDSYASYSKGMPLTSDDMKWFFAHYAPATQWSDPRISVLRTPDLCGSPPTWIATAEYDVLRDEGEKYARRLMQVGIKVDLHRIDGLPHGFARLFNLIDTARDAVALAASAIASHVSFKANSANPAS